MRRICSCDSVEEFGDVIRPVLKLVESKSKLPLDYADLYRQARSFAFDSSRERAKIAWMKAFFSYGRKQKEEKTK